MIGLLVILLVRSLDVGLYVQPYIRPAHAGTLAILAANLSGLREVHMWSREGDSLSAAKEVRLGRVLLYHGFFWAV